MKNEKMTISVVFCFLSLFSSAEGASKKKKKVKYIPLTAEINKTPSLYPIPEDFDESEFPPIASSAPSQQSERQQISPKAVDWLSDDSVEKYIASLPKNDDPDMEIVSYSPDYTNEGIVENRLTPLSDEQFLYLQEIVNLQKDITNLKIDQLKKKFTEAEKKGLAVKIMEFEGALNNLVGQYNKLFPS